MHKNKFAVGIAVVIALIFTAYFFVIHIPERDSETKQSQAVFEMQRTCSRDGLAWYNEHFGEQDIAYVSTFLRGTHYNQKLNTCLVSVYLIGSRDWVNSGFTYEVRDIYSNKQEPIVGQHFPFAEPAKVGDPTSSAADLLIGTEFERQEKLLMSE